MAHSMKPHLNVNMSQDEVVLLRMLSLMEKHLIEIGLYKNQSMNILVVRLYRVIIYYQWTLREKILVKMAAIASLPFLK